MPALAEGLASACIDCPLTSGIPYGILWARLETAAHLANQIMGVISDQLKQLIKEMEESDRRLKSLVSDHIFKSERAWRLMEEILEEEAL